MLVKLKGNPFNICVLMVYAPTSDSSEEEIDKFYDTLDTTKGQCSSQDVIIVMGDLNAKVGQDQDRMIRIVGKYGLGTRNDVKNQIDYITINNRFRNAVKQSKAFPGTDCGSDHIPVICKLMVKLKKLKQAKPRLQFETLQSNPEFAGKKSCSSGGCLKAKDGTIILEEDKILERWTEYMQELFQDDREEFETEKLTDVINEINDSGEFPEELSKSIFTALPKKPRSKEV
ncbi:craniofacial development protein 2-like [Penaeus monodon]|uniref:craniofacial development protein 2-like n=1 Tax=Penaeus monodon TaxID=6687 RepID=UPI0018A74B52|nr:craniofacial development protein 2-like [Penaeus monodon]